jgi:biopolymer transport protein TolR
MGTAVGPGARTRAEINMTPMIDVLLVLIIIFMIITPVRSRGFNTVVPQPAATDTQPERNYEIVITVRPGGAFLLNREPLDRVALKARMTQIFASGPDRPVFVRGEGELQFGDIAEVVDLARGVGVYRVALIES